ncbi:MAG: SpoIIE family protein phosphatase [Anaerolineales bacterium]
MSVQVLRDLPLFASLPADELRTLVSAGERKQLPAAAVLIWEGSRNEGLSVLIEGQVEVIKALGGADERQLAVHGPGAILGEMGLFNPDGLHTASVRSLTPLVLLDFSEDAIFGLMERRPRFARDLISMVTQRMKKSENATIQDLQEKNLQLRQAYRQLEAAQAEIIDKERMERELEVARGIQSSILPAQLPACEGIEFAASMAPMRAVGGDFYDFIELLGGRVGVAIGDVSDHGVASALLMAISVTLLRSEIRRGIEPAEALITVNQQLIEGDHLGMFVTLLYAVLDPTSRQLNYVRAGHNPPLLLAADGKVRQLPTQAGQPLGLLPDPALDAGSLTLDPGCSMLLYTDGVTEAMNSAGEMFSLERTVSALQALGPTASADEICTGLHRQLETFRGTELADDDVTTVVIKAL